MRKTLKIGFWFVAISVVAASATGIYATSTGTSGGTELRPDDKALLVQGAGVYAENCASCHGADLKGEKDWRKGNPDGTLKAPPHDETGHTWHHKDELLFRVTKYGTAKGVGLEDFKSNMPAFEGTLSDQEIIAALSWIKAQWPDVVRERHDMINERARNQSQ